jgi:DNA-binding NtrC family response regulator
MITASGAKERAIQAVNMGAQAYLLKPFDADAITQVVQQWIGHASP